MLRRKIGGLVNGGLCTVISIKAHHVTVHFDGMTQPYPVERVKGRFVVLKNVFVQWKQLQLILEFAVTVHKCRWTVPSLLYMASLYSTLF